MPAFRYIALTTQGKKIKGVAEADSARVVRQQLRDRQLTTLTIDPITKKSFAASKNFFQRYSTKISTADLALITRQMSTLLQAGVPIDEMLTAISQQTDKQSLKQILLGVRAKVLEGYSLAEGMKAFPWVFPVLYYTMIAAGERSGKLAKLLDQLADYTEKQYAIQQKIKQALIYPIVMMSISISIVIFLLIYVVPKIVAVFSQTNQVLPFATTFLIAVSHFIQYDGLYLLFGLILLVLSWRQLQKHEKYRYKIDMFFLKLPMIGVLIKKINTARFGRTFGILHSASVPVLDAMQAANQLIKPLPMMRKIQEATSRVQEGCTIYTALQNTHCFAPMFLHLVASGESSGQLDVTLEKAAHYLEKEVENVIQTLLTLFEPLMILMMGGIVLYIVLAIMLPIFALDNIV